MPLKDILVHIDGSQQSMIRFQMAIELAKKHRAHLTGLYVAPRLPVLFGRVDEQRRSDTACLMRA